MVEKDHNRRRAPCASAAADLRLQRNAVAIHRLGPRAVYELLVELGAITGHRAAVDELAERHGAIDRTHLHVAGGDRFAPRPLLLVRHGP